MSQLSNSHSAFSRALNEEERDALYTATDTTTPDTAIERVLSVYTKNGFFGLSYREANCNLYVLVNDMSDGVPYDHLRSCIDALNPTKIYIPFNSKFKLKNAEYLNISEYYNNNNDIFDNNDIFNNNNVLSKISTYPLINNNILSFNIINFTNKLFITQTDLYALGVFDKSHHPNSYFAKHKEGNSLYAHLNKCRTSQGKRLLSDWLRLPLTSIAELERRHSLVDIFIQDADIHSRIWSIVAGMRSYFQQQGDMLTLGEWRLLLQHCDSCMKLSAAAAGGGGLEHEIIDAARDKIRRDEMGDIVQMIYDTVDFEESVKERRVVVKYGVDEELDELKRFYEGLDIFLGELRERVVQGGAVVGGEQQQHSDNLRVVYFPQLGFLICLPLNEALQQQEAELIFSTEHSNYYKNELMKQVDEDIGDIYHLIVDKETDVLYGVQGRVMSDEYLKVISSTFDISAELDVLCAFACVCREFNYVRPVLTQDDVVEICNGRHPLLESSEYVCNSTRMSSDMNIQLVTGCNYSGKSVYLCQVGLIVILAQVGCFIPAASGSRIAIRDAIITRIYSYSENTFMNDLIQVSLGLKYASDQSLVLIDEFGKGTSSIDGISLFCAVMRYYCGRSTHVVAVTHFHEVFHHDLVKSEKVRYYTMNSIVQEDRITFLYQLSEGREDSHGLYCARLAGIGSDVIERARCVIRDLVEWRCVERMSSGNGGDGDDYIDVYDRFIGTESEEEEELEGILELVKSRVTCNTPNH